MVKEFHKIFKLKVKVGRPGWHEDEDLLKLRMGLISEEYGELIDAYAERDLVETVDALADLVYVIYGMALTLGVDLDHVISEVHFSNMSKLDADGNPLFRDDGKVLKSNLFQEPRIQKILDIQEDIASRKEALEYAS